MSRQTVEKPGCSVIHSAGASISPSLSRTCCISLQHTHSKLVLIISHLLHKHLIIYIYIFLITLHRYIDVFFKITNHERVSILWSSWFSSSEDVSDDEPLSVGSY